MMKERPILFSAPMARAILEGRKTQTRRVIKPQSYEKNGQTFHPNEQWVCPYGKPGDRLWVRESVQVWGVWNSNGKTKTGKRKWKFVELDKRARYHGDFVEQPTDRMQIGFWTRPSIFMPRWASRINLEITAVRVERLQDISEEDAIAEGAFLKKCHCSEVPKSVLGINFQQTGCHIHGTEFKHLWQSINGTESWDANPWVWVVEFKRVKPA